MSALGVLVFFVRLLSSLSSTASRDLGQRPTTRTFHAYIQLCLHACAFSRSAFVRIYTWYPYADCYEELAERTRASRKRTGESEEASLRVYLRGKGIERAFKTGRDEREDDPRLSSKALCTSIQERNASTQIDLTLFVSLNLQRLS